MRNLHFLKSLLITAMLLVTINAWSLTFPLPANGDVIGTIKTVTSKHGDTLESLAYAFDVGPNQMQEANPALNASGKLSSGKTVIIPSQFILPRVAREGIVINLSEQRLYFFDNVHHQVITHPVGIGREGRWKTPTGTTKVVAKKENPIWRPTNDVRAEAASKGTPIPNIFPPGPDNPLGKHAIKLSWPTYLIHGTNQAKGIGLRVSAGCIRLSPEAIAALFPLVDVGTPVTIIDTPIKFGKKNNQLYVETHKALADSTPLSAEDVLDTLKDTQKTPSTTDKQSLLKKLPTVATGIPIPLQPKS